jgi:hypothetical protein
MQIGVAAELGSYINNEGVDICIKAQCCEGIPYEIPCPATNITSNIENAIKTTRIAKYKGQAIKLRLYYWD